MRSCRPNERTVVGQGEAEREQRRIDRTRVRLLGGKVGIATALTVACQLPGLSLAVMGRGAPFCGAQCEPFGDD